MFLGQPHTWLPIPGCSWYGYLTTEPVTPQLRELTWVTNGCLTKTWGSVVGALHSAKMVGKMSPLPEVSTTIGTWSCR